MFPQRGQIIHLSLKNAQKSIPIILSLNDYYCLNWGFSHIIVGATRENDIGFIPKNTVEGVQGVLRQGVNMIPEIAYAEISDIRVGLRPYSRDKRPFIGSIEKVAGLWVATGHGPLGLTTAPYTGKMLANAISKGEYDDLMVHFNPNRG